MVTRVILLARHETPPRFASCPLTKMREAERRQALGCSGTRRRANDVRPQAPAGALRPMTRDVRLSALHRGICDSGPARDEAIRLHRLRAPRVRSSWRRAGFRSLPGAACKAAA